MESKIVNLVVRFTVIALICPLYVEEGGIFDKENRRVATIFEISNPQEFLQLNPAKGEGEHVVINLLDWQVCLLLTAEDNLYHIKFVSFMFSYWQSSTACQLSQLYDLS